jgi:hypothetical protein
MERNEMYGGSLTERKSVLRKDSTLYIPVGPALYAYPLALDGRG